jgi:hypothetical protein
MRKGIRTRQKEAIYKYDLLGIGSNVKHIIYLIDFTIIPIIYTLCQSDRLQQKPNTILTPSLT